MKNKKIIVIVLLIVLVVGGFAGYQVYENHVKEETISSCKTTIKKEYQTFTKEENRKKKLE